MSKKTRSLAERWATDVGFGTPAPPEIDPDRDVHKKAQARTTLEGELLVFDKDQKRIPAGLPGGGRWVDTNLFGHLDDGPLGQAGKELRETPPPPPPSPAGLQVESSPYGPVYNVSQEDIDATEEAHVAGLQDIGRKARKAIEADPRSKAADKKVREAKAAYSKAKKKREETRDKYDAANRERLRTDPTWDYRSSPEVQAMQQSHQAMLDRKRDLSAAQKEKMEVRSEVFRDLLRKTRPVGKDTGDKVKAQAKEPTSRYANVSDKSAVETDLAKQVRKESQELPASWVRAANKSGPKDWQGETEADTAPIYLTDTNDPDVMSFNANTRVLSAATDDLLGRSGTPDRLHEITHAVQQGVDDIDDPDSLFASDMAFYHTKAKVRPGFGFFGPIGFASDDFMLDPDKVGEGRSFFDRYSGRTYGSDIPADELSSSGVEYLMGGIREYAVDNPNINPWDKRYSEQMDYMLGLMLKGGPKEEPDDWREAGLPFPDWYDRFEYVGEAQRNDKGDQVDPSENAGKGSLPPNLVDVRKTDEFTAGKTESIASLGAELRDEPPPPPPPPARDSAGDHHRDTDVYEQADAHVTALQDIGKEARKVIQAHPDSKAADARVNKAKKESAAAKKKFAERSAAYDRNEATYGEFESARLGQEDARAELIEAQRNKTEVRSRLFRELLGKTRPTGKTTDQRVKMLPGTLMRANKPTPTEERLAEQMSEESQELPAGWIAAANQGFPGDGIIVEQADRSEQMSYSSDRRVLLAVTDSQADVEREYNRDVTRPTPSHGAMPQRMHEMTHAVQTGYTGGHGLFDSDMAFWQARGTNQPQPGFIDLLGDPYRLDPNKGTGKSKKLFDPYSGKTYGDNFTADELSSTGVEYLMGGNRDYVKENPNNNPWDPKYSEQMDYTMGLMLKGGPPEMSEDYALAGMPTPDWVENPPPPKDITVEEALQSPPVTAGAAPSIPPSGKSWSAAQRESILTLDPKRKETLDEATKLLDQAIQMPDGMPKVMMAGVSPSGAAVGSFDDGVPEVVTDPGRNLDLAVYGPEMKFGSNAGRLTVVHEFGHYLDRYANTATTEPGHTPPTIISSVLPGGSVPESRDADATALQDAILDSPSHRALFDPSQLPPLYKEKIAGREVPTVYASDYVGDPHEAFARSFAQYVAVKTDTLDELRERYAADPKLQKEAGGDPDVVHSYTRFFVLDDDEFAPIEKAFDDYFAKRGWLPEGGETEVGVTPYRGSGAGPEYFATARYKAFENRVQKEADDLGITIEGFDRTRGVWAGGGEPAARLRLRGSTANINEFMDRIGKRFNQDAVIAWRGDPDGPDYRYESKEPVKVDDDTIEAAIAEVNKGLPEEHQLQGATRGPDGHLVFIDIDNKAAQAIRDVAEKLDLWFDYAKGHAELRFKGDDY